MHSVVGPPSGTPATRSFAKALPFQVFVSQPWLPSDRSVLLLPRTVLPLTTVAEAFVESEMP